MSLMFGRRARSQVAALAAGVVVSGLLCVGCGSPASQTGSLAVLSYQRTVAAGSSRFSLVQTVRAQVDPMVVAFSGVSTFGTDPRGDGSVVISQGGRRYTMSLRWLDSRLYELIEGSATWTEDSEGSQFLQIGSSSGLADPALLLGVLRAAAVSPPQELQAAAVVGGVETREYEETANLDKVYSSYSGPPTEVKFWIDSESRVVELSYSVIFVGAPISYTIQYFGFGTPVDVIAPKL
jgi:hypothetical protein